MNGTTASYVSFYMYFQPIHHQDLRGHFAPHSKLLRVALDLLSLTHFSLPHEEIRPPFFATERESRVRRKRKRRKKTYGGATKRGMSLCGRVGGGLPKFQLARKAAGQIALQAGDPNPLPSGTN